MDIDIAAKCFAEIGHPTRLAIFQLLVKAGHPGLTVGEIQKHLSIPGSTLSHHLSHLTQASLIAQQREGRVLHCRVNFEQMQTLIDFFTKECCTGIATNKEHAG